MRFNNLIVTHLLGNAAVLLEVSMKAFCWVRTGDEGSVAELEAIGVPLDPQHLGHLIWSVVPLMTNA